MLYRGHGSLRSRFQERWGIVLCCTRVYASTFIFAAIISFYAFGTEIRPINILGMLLLVAGMYFMGR